MNDELMPELIAPDLDDPRIQAALEELQAMILAKFPAATFDAYLGPDSDGIWLAATVDVDDLDEVTDVVFPRIVDMQVDEGLPVNVVGDWPPERLHAYIVQEKAKLAALDPAYSASSLTV
jgi:hypothetical protein